MKQLQKRHDIESLFKLKLDLLNQYQILHESDSQICKLLRQIRGHINYNIRDLYSVTDEKCIDQAIWGYLVDLFHLERYMLCTEYDKLQKEIDTYQTPQYTIENAKGWLDSLKGLIHENIKMMCKNVYDNIVNGTYWTGGDRKKRNNNGIDKQFILSTYDYNRVFSYWTDKPTITDDLEKVCYLMDKKELPEITLISQAKADRVQDVACEYFSIKMCKNGNTHYKITKETVAMLNRIGSDGRTIGEDIKIKILDL